MSFFLAHSAAHSKKVVEVLENIFKVRPLGAALALIEEIAHSAHVSHSTEWIIAALAAHVDLIVR